MEDWKQYINKVNCMDAMDLLKELPDKSIDLVLTDPPYGTTSCEWDKVFDFKLMWKEFNRISNIQILTASQPFNYDLVSSNRKNFKYQWYWEKEQGTGFALANKQPLRIIEEIIVFYEKPQNYYPQKIKLKIPKIIKRKSNTKSKSANMASKEYEGKSVLYEYYTPINKLFFNRESGKHPTQKPVSLFSYLIRTYTKENQTILDPFMGSWTTAVACQNLKRNFIGCELDKDYCEIGKQRLRQQTLI